MGFYSIIIKRGDNMSLAGIGPVYVFCITVLTGICLKFPVIKDIMFIRIIGGGLITIGVVLWVQAALKSNLHKNIKEKHLITEGAYAYVRNPIYSAFMLAEVGVILFQSNLLAIPAFLLYWALMTVLVKRTEEKWLVKEFGEEYKEYCRKVNRCIPWIRRGKS